MVPFPTPNELLANEPVQNYLAKNISEHLTELLAEFDWYFSKLPPEKKIIDLTHNPFQRSVEEIPEDLQEDFIELINNSATEDDFKHLLIEEFSAGKIYPQIAEKALKVLVPFSTTSLFM